MKPTNQMKKYCDGTKGEVSFCGDYGSMSCLADGNCNYRNTRVAENLGEEFEKDSRLKDMLGGERKT